jgi:hypothetical protein
VAAALAPRRLATSALAFAALLAVGALAHRRALTDPEPRTDEQVFVGAALAVATGGSPYDHPVYNYPPPLAELGARLVDAGDPGRLLVVARLLGLAAMCGLAQLAAGYAGLGTGRRTLLAALLVAAAPIVHATFWLGNLAAIPALLALVGWRHGERRQIVGGLLAGASLAFKPTALAGACYLTARWLGAARSSRRRPAEALAWIAAAALALLPWLDRIPALVGRMLHPPLFSSRNLSLRRAALGLGFDLPALLLLGGVLLAALWLARHRPVDAIDRIHAAPVVALLGLPVAWSHGFLLVLPLQVAAASLWWRRRAVRAGRAGAAALVERWSVPLALAAIQGSFAAGIELGVPGAVQTLIVLVPTLSPLVLLAYLLGHRGESAAGAQVDSGSILRPRTS